MHSFVFTVFADESGYRLCVVHGEHEFLWPDSYSTLEKVGEQIFKALKTASECRGEMPKPKSG